MLFLDESRKVQSEYAEVHLRFDALPSHHRRSRHASAVQASNHFATASPAFANRMKAVADVITQPTIGVAAICGNLAGKRPLRSRLELRNGIPLCWSCR